MEYLDGDNLHRFEFGEVSIYPSLDLRPPIRRNEIIESGSEGMSTVRGSQASGLCIDQVIRSDCGSEEVDQSDNLSDTQENVPEMHINLSQQNIVVEDVL